MRLTQYSDYGLRVLIYLALKNPERATIGEIAEAYGISRNHLMKVVQQLAADGHVRSTRGVGGGLELGAPAERIRVGQVIRDMETDFNLVECMRPEDQCAITAACRLKGIMRRATTVFLAELDRYSLADLLAPAAAERLRKQLDLARPT